MRIQLTVRVASSAVPDRVVAVECAPGARAGELARALEAPGLWVAGRPIPDTSLVGMPPLLHAAVVQLDGPPTASPPRSPWELRVLDGPDVGLRVPLPFGRSLLGRADGTTVALTDPRVSRRHAELEVRRTSEITVRDVGGTNGTWVCGARVDTSPRALEEGDVVEVGSTRLQARMSPRGEGGLEPDGAGHLLVPGADVTRPVEPECVRFPDAPAARPRMRFPLIALMVPLLLAGALAAVMHSLTMLLFGLTGPVLSLTTWLGERRRRSGAVSEGEHAAAVQEASATLGDALLRERQRLERSHPPLAEVLAVAETRGAALWRGSGAEVRLGVGARRSRVMVDGGSTPAPTWLHDVPVTVDLAEVGVLGVCGERRVTVSSVAAVMARLATAAPPSRLELTVVVADPTRGGDWDFVGWLPHLRAMAVAGEAGPHLDRLVAEIGRREDADRVRAPPERSLVVVVVDGWPVARNAVALDSIVRRGPAVGVVAVVLATSRSQLPACGAVLTLASDRATLSSEDSGSSGALVPDRPGRLWVDRTSRALAPLRELSVAAVAATTDLPMSVRLLDLVGEVDAASVAARWQRRSASTRAVLGVTSAGALAVDLAVDGPHALIAGTTGAGKSELLQTLVCSLALANRPDEMTFLLVDYKGGAAFRDCARLPHVVGVVTDLDGQLTARALTSLTAELRRRERLFAGVGAGDMDAYRRARATAADLPALPRLVIAIDEFRVLAEELPDFVPGLVRLAAVGRSLGVHLVLATQRPGGILSADIRANVSLRIALRVRDRTDSVDVLDDPDAASIDANTPGRATLRGAATPLTRFQSARVTVAAGPIPRLTVTPPPRVWPGRPEREAAARSRVATSNDPTDPAHAAEPATGPRDLDRIVDAVRGATRILGVAEPQSPWLPPLPDRLVVSSLGAGESLESVPLGLEDVPAEQVQRPWYWQMADGHLGVAGGGRSGRTSAVLTIAAQLASAQPASRVHLYAIGPRSLSALAVLPHVAAVADVDDADHIRLILERLAALRPEGLSPSEPRAESRRGSMSWVDSVPESGPGWATAQPVLVVDGWERLAGHAHGSLAADLRTLVETSSGSGLRVVVTGGRAVLAGQLAGLLGQRLVLALGDPVELALAGIPARAVPGHQPLGRALDARTHHEVQLGWLGPDPTSVLADLSAGMPAHWAARAPSRVRRLPTTIDVPVTRHQADVVVVGVRDGDLEPVGFATTGERRIVVLGPARSGRTSALVTLARGFRAKGHPVAVVGRGLDPWPAIRANGTGGTDDWAADATDNNDGAVMALSGTQPADLERLVEARRRHPDLVVLVDDAERLAGLPLEPVLLEIARRVDEDRGVVVVATSIVAFDARMGALAQDLAIARTGLLLQPSAGTRVLGAAVIGETPRIPGRGVLVTARATHVVQVADPR